MSNAASCVAMRAAPVSYSDELAAAILDRLAAGETLKAICRSEGMPDAATLWRWRDANREFRAAYDRAREVSAEIYAGETIEIADDGRNDWMEANGKDDAGWQLNGEHVRRSDIRIKSRQWYAAKLAPGRFGERSQVEVSGKLTLEHLVLQSFGAASPPAIEGEVVPPSEREGED